MPMNWRRWFGKDAGLFGKPLQLLKGSPSAKRGELRPGHLSVAVTVAKKHGRSATEVDPTEHRAPPLPDVVPIGQQHGQQVPVTPGSGLNLPLVPVGQQRGQQVPVTPGSGLTLPLVPVGQQHGQPIPVGASSPADGGPGKGGKGAPYIAVGARWAGAPLVPAGQQRGAPAGVRLLSKGDVQTLTRGAAMVGKRLAGLGDVDGETVPFVGNAQAWVTVQKYPLLTEYGSGSASSGVPIVPVNWPDGTPVMSSYWLPKLDLSARFDPVKLGTFAQGENPFTRVDAYGKNYREQHESGWMRDTGESSRLLSGQTGWDWMVDFGQADDWNGQAPHWPEPMGKGRPPFDRLLYLDGPYGGVGKGFSDWSGHDAWISHYIASFNWATYAPSTQAAIWLHLNLFDPTNANWTVADAEVYRADLQTFESGGEPYELPGAAWLCLDVLDAMITGTHGMPVMIRADGTIDQAVYTQFMVDHPEWAELLHFGKHGQGMLAIVNDLGAFAGEVVHVNPPAPTPTPTPTPIPTTTPPDSTPPPGGDPRDPRDPYDPYGGYYPPPPEGDGTSPYFYGGGDPRRDPWAGGGQRDEYADGPTGQGYYGGGDDPLQPLLDLLVYFLSLSDEDFIAALLELDPDIFGIVADVFGLRDAA